MLQNESISEYEDRDNYDNNLTVTVPQETDILSMVKTLTRIVKRNIFPIVGIAGVVTFISWYNNRNPVLTYTGSFQILVEPVSSEAQVSEPSNLTGSSKQANIRPSETDYSTIVALLKSSKILASVSDEVQTKYPQINVQRISNQLQVERIGSSKIDQTKIIQVNYAANDPDLVELVLEETAKKYLQYSLEERKTHIGQGLEFIDKQLPELQNRVNSLQLDLQKLQEQNPLIDSTTKGQDLLEQLSQLRSQKITNKSELNKLQALRDNLQNQLKMDVEEAVLVANLSEDSNYQALLEQYKKIESEIALQSVLFEATHPVIQRLKDQRQNVLNLLNQEQQKIVGLRFSAKSSSSPVLNLQNTLFSEMTEQLLETITQIKLLQVENDSLTQTIGEFEQQTAKIPQIIRQYNKLEQELKIASQTLEQLLTRRDTLSLELAQSQFPWEIISEPQLKRDAFGNPEPLPLDSQKKLLTGLMGGLLAGIAAAILLEKFQNTFYTAEDIEDTIKLPLLENIAWRNAPQVLSGSIPATKMLPGKIQTYYDDFVIFESFKSLYANLRVRHNKSAIRSIVVSSVVQEDNSDRFAVAWNLAETAATTGQRVLLVDADLSKQQLPTKANFVVDKGLSDLLFKGTDYQQSIQQSSHLSNLFILTAGQIPSSFSNLLGFGQMPKLMAEFNRDFDFVIYNTAPILASMDGNLLAAHTDGILLTVAINKTKKSLLTKALKQIENFNLPLLGVVSTEINTVN